MTLRSIAGPVARTSLLDAAYSAADRAGYDVILSALTPSRDEQRAVETLLDLRCNAADDVAAGVAESFHRAGVAGPPFTRPRAAHGTGA